MTQKNATSLILVDGSSYLYRAFHALPALRNSKGFPTGAIYGVINMLRKLIADHEGEPIVVVFDAKGKTFRDEMYSDYKATRSEMPEDLVLQIEMIHRMIKAMGLPILMVEGVEADDVIGTLAIQAVQKNKSVLISTGDKDLAQLVNEHIHLVNTMSNTILNPETVLQKFGVPPERITDYLALIGDTSDNIPGVPQVGPKTAAKWLQHYGSLDNIIENASQITGKVGESLRASLGILDLAKKLVTIKKDVALPIPLEALKISPPNPEMLIQFFKELEFKTWLSALLENNSHADPIQSERKKTHYETIKSKEVLQNWCDLILKKQIFAFDIQPPHLSMIKPDMAGISLGLSPGKAAYIPFAHADDAPLLSETAVLEKLKPLFENEKIVKIGHHLKYAIEVLASKNMKVQGTCFDTMLESYILDSESHNHNIENLSLKYLGWRTIPLKDIIGVGSKQIEYSAAAIDPSSVYAAENIDVCLQLHQLLWPNIEKQSGLQFIFEKIEMPLVKVLARIERNGVLIDAEKMKIQGIELEKKCKVLEEEAYTLSGKPFNINSPKQLQQILFEDLKIPVIQKTPTGQPSTAEPILQELALEYPLPKIIIEYRTLNKLISTYTSKLPGQIHPLTGRIHTTYNQTGAVTGRLSSSDPNLQNIPIRTFEGRRIRQAFIASPGTKIISADYSQIELRLMAHISNDPNLLAAFAQNLDIHQATAAEILGIPLEQVTPDQRRNAKAINFGLIYGMSAFGLAKQLKIERHAAQNYIELYFNRYPQVKVYMDTTRASAKEQGYVETLWGRRLYLPEIRSSQAVRQKAAERAAINAPLQGTAADIIKAAMINLDRWLIENHMDAKMIMQVHDELVFEVPENELEKVLLAVKKYMTEAIRLKVPVTISIGCGDNWDEAQENSV